MIDDRYDDMVSVIEALGTIKCLLLSGGSKISRRGRQRHRRRLPRRYVSKILYVNVKESGPLWGAPAAPPGSANVTSAYL